MPLGRQTRGQRATKYAGGALAGALIGGGLPTAHLAWRIGKFTPTKVAPGKHEKFFRRALGKVRGIGFGAEKRSISAKVMRRSAVVAGAGALAGVLAVAAHNRMQQNYLRRRETHQDDEDNL